MSERVLIGIKDVASILGVHRHQVERLIREKKIEFIQLPGMKRYLFTRHAVDLFIQSCATGPDVGPMERTTTRRKPPKLAHIGQGQNAQKMRPHEWRRGFRG